MNNHVHLLLVPQYDHSLAKTMQKLALRFTQHINKKYKRTGRLWECRFHSAIVDKESYLWSVCRYIERNPVRAKIVDEPIQYLWSSARYNASKQKNSFIEPIWQNSDERKEYTEFLNIPDDKNDIENIAKSTYAGRPIGSEDFFDKLVNTLGIVIKKRPIGRPPKN